jgi:hypothetical protein
VNMDINGLAWIFHNLCLVTPCHLNQLLLIDSMVAVATASSWKYKTSQIHFVYCLSHDGKMQILHWNEKQKVTYC